MKVNPIVTSKAPSAVGPYSQGTKTDNLIFTSGQLPIIPETGDLIKDDIKKATKQSLDNVLAIIEEGGATLNDIVKVNIFVKNMDNFSLVNEVYEEFFGNHKPARSCVEVSKLPKNGDIEIEAIAIV
ncbi:RidA family protein [Schnuerera sp. xch1]|uniref:RidA family protein n=1 Tax=Schnuerera sp. xch1 TaxID=2874283 RepID=UPI001CC07809|nr:RidA family protein [Schnuerera sp. xch1]MBZ2175362.1 RidA family protein [Schnuerera sp. xch1]